VALLLLPLFSEFTFVVSIFLDVTGTPTNANIIIEKCWNPRLRTFICQTLSELGISYDLYRGCSDPIASQDETDVYSKITDFTFFLGLPVRGGDYNEGNISLRLLPPSLSPLIVVPKLTSSLSSPVKGPVFCFKKDIKAVSKALIVLSQELLTNFRTEAVVEDKKEEGTSETDEEAGVYFGNIFKEWKDEARPLR
jgi:hypothetical protein